MKEFTEAGRISDYELTPDDTVIDCGGFEGNWALHMSERHNCHVLVFEPVPEFYRGLVAKLAPWPKVRTFNIGLGAETRTDKFRIKGDMTGIMSVGTIEVPVIIRDVAAVFDELNQITPKEVAVMKINCEGSEYQIFERMIQEHLLPRVRNFQVQWHSVVPDYSARRHLIEAFLSSTHEETWPSPDFDNAWANWRRKT